MRGIQPTRHAEQLARRPERSRPQGFGVIAQRVRKILSSAAPPVRSQAMDSTLTTYTDHFSLTALSGSDGRHTGSRRAWADAGLDASIRSPSTAAWTDRRAGKGILFDEPCHTLYRTGGAPTTPPGPPERPRHCDHRWGKKGPTYTFTPESQVLFGAHKLSDSYTQRGPKNAANPAMYRPWTATMSSAFQDPMEIGAHWREAAKATGSSSLRTSTGTLSRASLYKLGDPPFS